MLIALASLLFVNLPLIYNSMYVMVSLMDNTLVKRIFTIPEAKELFKIDKAGIYEIEVIE